jgi:hypothetical protein
MPNAPLESAPCTAVAIAEGLVWSSSTVPTSLCPFTPPSAFCIAIRALNPAAAWLNSADPGPVSDVIIARVIGVPDVAAPAVPESAPSAPAVIPPAINAARPTRASRRCGRPARVPLRSAVFIEPTP